MYPGIFEPIMYAVWQNALYIVVVGFFRPSKMENWFQLYNMVFKGYQGILLYFVSEESK